MKTPIEQIYLDCLNLAYVPRWTITPMLRSQSVAEHSYRVAILSAWLASEMKRWADVGASEVDRGAMLMLALNHDHEEAWSGDQPGPDKGTPSLTPIAGIGLEECIVRVADALEALLWWRAWGPDDEQWVHLWNPAGGREVRKIVHYGAKHPEILFQAASIWKQLTTPPNDPPWENRYL